MASLSWFGIFILLFVYDCDSKEIPNNILRRIARLARSSADHQNRGLFANVNNVENAAKDEGSEEGRQAKNGHKKQVVDAIHLGPYHHGHSWGTTSMWPGFAGWGHAWGHTGHHVGWTGYPSYKSKIPSKNLNVKVPSPSSLHNSQSVKRWWPGYMGGWGNWGWGNTGYPGWGNLGWGPFLRSGIPRIAESPSKRWWPGYMGGWGGWGWGNAGYPGWGLGWGHGNMFGHGFGHPHRSQIPKSSSTLKRQDIDAPFDGFEGDFGDGFEGNFGDGFNFPWGPPPPYYGPFDGFGEWGYPGFGFGPMPFPEFSQGAYYKSNIPKHNDEQPGVARQFVGGFHPGSYGWGGVIYPGSGLGGVFPLLGAHTGYPVAGPFYKSMIPKRVEEKAERHQVINYHPGCYGWGGCLYPGCGYMGGFSWPCHHHGCCRPCCCRRSKAPTNMGPRYEKGQSRQEIASPVEDEDEDEKHNDNSMERSTSDLTKMAMGFPGMENFRSPFGSNIDPQSGPVAAQLGISNQLPTQAMNEPNELMPQTDELSEFPQSFKSPEETMNGLSDEEAKPIKDLMNNFNMGPEGDTGMPLTTDGGDSSPQASRRGVIPETKVTEIQKKQAVTYPYASTMPLPYYMQAHGGIPYTAVVPHASYPVSYLPGAQLVDPVADPLHPSHSIHVGTPNVKVDVQTRTHVAHVAQSSDKTIKRRHALKTFLSKPAKMVIK